MFKLVSWLAQVQTAILFAVWRSRRLTIAGAAFVTLWQPSLRAAEVGISGNYDVARHESMEDRGAVHLEQPFHVEDGLHELPNYVESARFERGMTRAARPSGTFTLLGISLAGAEFNPSAVPGKVNVDYTYPTHEEIDYFASKRFNIVRLPFLWPRLQPVQNGPLDPAELARLDDVVSYANLRNMNVEIEAHDYGYGYGSLIGGTIMPDATFADLWSRLATHFSQNPKVLFGLMNEPHIQSAARWAVSAQAAVRAIRAAGATSQEILVPGTAWSGGHTWISSGNAAALAATIEDPSNNFAFVIHQYLDRDASGTSPTVVSPTIGPERLRAVTEWAEAHKFKLFLSEFGAGGDVNSLVALDNMLDYMHAHTGCWQGGAMWAGGPWWHDYAMSIEPLDGIDKPQIKVLENHLPRAVRTAE